MVTSINRSVAIGLLLGLSACNLFGDTNGKKTNDPKTDVVSATGTAATKLPPPVEAFDAMDTLSASLADRAAKRLGFDTKDYLVVVTEAGVPPGTLLEPATARAKSWTACAPGDAMQPPTIPLPSTFPTVKINDSLAANFGLDEGVISQIANANIDVNSGHTVNLSFEKVNANYLADDQLEQLLAQPACKAAIAGKKLYLVRGEITGKRALDLNRTLKAGGAVGVAKIGKIEFTPLNKGVEVAINDPDPVQFLQVVAVLDVPPVVVTGAAPTPTPAPTILPPPPPMPVLVPHSGAGGAIAGMATKPAPGIAGGAVASKPFIYVQRDVTDASKADAKVIQALAAGGSFRVVPKVEAVPHAAMPTTAQMRYFNDADRDAAVAALARLQTLFPDAEVRKIGLKAPAGQLEAWLPKTAS